MLVSCSVKNKTVSIPLPITSRRICNTWIILGKTRRKSLGSCLCGRPCYRLPWTLLCALHFIGGMLLRGNIRTAVTLFQTGGGLNYVINFFKSSFRSMLLEKNLSGRNPVINFSNVPHTLSTSMENIMRRTQYRVPWTLLCAAVRGTIVTTVTNLSHHTDLGSL